MKMMQCFGRKTEVKRELAKCRSRWQDDIKTDGKEISCHKTVSRSERRANSQYED